MVNKNITISISEEIMDKLEKKRQETNFDFVSDYIIYILEQVVSKEKTKYEKERGYTKEEEEEMKQRLEAGGYF